MDLLEAHFSIIETRNCPMYDKGDCFSVSGLSFSAPEEKETCLLLARKLAEIVLPQHKQKTLEKEYSCPGCTGILKFSPATSNKSKFMTSHLQRMLAAERNTLALQSDSVYDKLATFTLFQGMEEEHLRIISERLQEKTFTANQHIVFRGRPGNFLYIIISGTVDVLNEEGGVLTTLHQGETFGEMSLFSGKPVSATIRANNTVRTLLLSGKDLSTILIRYPFLQMIFTRMLVRRLSTANAAKSESHEAGVTGKIEEVSVAELFQMFNTNSKTGMFKMQLPSGAGLVTFIEGQVIKAEYADKKGNEAFWAILREQQGSFTFTSYLSLDDMAGEPLGSFIALLMEGMRQQDEAAASPEQLAEK